MLKHTSCDGCLAWLIGACLGISTQAATANPLEIIPMPHCALTWWSPSNTPTQVQIQSVDRIATHATASLNELSALVDNHKSACRLRGVIESEIYFELWMPSSNDWNGKFLAAGVGGEAGTLNYGLMTRALHRGYATSSTDTGHLLTDKDWAFHRPDRQANFAARANHLLAIASKAIIRKFYARSAEKSYFVGCSGGGREGLKEVQNYPRDFDGVLAGSAGPDQLAASLRLLWMQYVMEPTHAGLMSEADWQLISDRTTAACDANDGVQDGVLEDPRQCHFDLTNLSCPSEKSATCLTADQIEYAKALFAPLKDENGAPIDQGLTPSVRLRFAPRSAFAFTLYGAVVHGDPKWDPLQLNIQRDLAAAHEKWPTLANDNPDLRPFQQHGGKLLYYHGWVDPFLPALSILAYQARVEKVMGPLQASNVMKIFMVPGMGHCSGGPGPDQFGASDADSLAPTPDNDMLSALEAWVEEGHRPERIIAAKYQDGRIVRTHPLCAYPKHAVYRGAGSTDDAENFVCQ